jgi:tetratricopeptide (TPR) repeat protein
MIFDSPHNPSEVDMKFKSLKLATRLAIAIALFFPAIGYSDQTDARLDVLFELLQSSADIIELQEAESAIWKIWYESGQQGIDALMEEAREAVQASDLSRAEALYSEVIEMAPAFSEGWNRRATVRYYRGNYDGSLEDIHSTLVLESRHFGAIWGLGMILGWQRDFSGAITAFERLLEIKPNARDARPRIEILKQEMVKNAV